MVKTSLNSNLKYKLAIFATLISFVVTFYAFWELNKVVVNIKSSRVKNAEIKRDIELVDKILKDKNQYANDIKKLKSTLPSDYYEIAFFTEHLERLSTANNLTMKINIDQKKKEEKESYNSVIYSLDIEGSYSGISEFLNQVSKLPYYTSVDYLKMETEQDHLVSEVKFRLFIQK